MAIVIDELVADVQAEPSTTESAKTASSSRQDRSDIPSELRRLASRAARVHAD
jgi:hypothetical protein